MIPPKNLVFILPSLLMTPVSMRQNAEGYVLKYFGGGVGYRQRQSSVTLRHLILLALVTLLYEFFYIGFHSLPINEMPQPLVSFVHAGVASDGGLMYFLQNFHLFLSREFFVLYILSPADITVLLSYYSNTFIFVGSCVSST
jgi:hypothetical protein